MSWVSAKREARRHLRVATGLVAIGLALLLVAGASSALADAAVQMTEGSATDINSWGFTPPEISVTVGQSVTWTNAGSIAHTATATGEFDTGLLDPGASKTLPMTAAGTFAYQCTPHPWMKGTVIVTVAAAAPAAAAPPTFTPAPAAAAPAAQAQATPTPFRFLTPTPFVPSKTTTTTTSPTSTVPRAGGVPLELVVPLLAGGAGALGSGIYLLRRRRN